jgi:hypothetical protein
VRITKGIKPVRRASLHANYSAYVAAISACMIAACRRCTIHDGSTQRSQCCPLYQTRTNKRRCATLPCSGTSMEYLQPRTSFESAWLAFKQAVMIDCGGGPSVPTFTRLNIKFRDLLPPLFHTPPDLAPAASTPWLACACHTAPTYSTHPPSVCGGFPIREQERSGRCDALEREDGERQAARDTMCPMLRAWPDRSRRARPAGAQAAACERSSWPE